MSVEWHNVFSSNVSEVGHDAEKKELYVRWSNGRVSVYSGVSAEIAEDVRNSWSVGIALNEQVKGKFNHRYE